MVYFQMGLKRWTLCRSGW